VHLSDLSLRRDALHRLGLGGLPLELRGGFIGGMMLQVPWRNLAGGRSCMVLEDVTVVVARPVWQSGMMAEGARVVAEKAAREAAEQAIRAKLEEVDAYFARKKTAAGERGAGATHSTRSEYTTSAGEKGPGDEREASLYETRVCSGPEFRGRDPQDPCAVRGRAELGSGKGAGVRSSLG